MAWLPKDDIIGKWKTVLVDQEMLNRAYIPQCMTAEFSKLGNEFVFRVGEVHTLVDEMTDDKVLAYSGQTITLLFDNTVVPTIANQYSYGSTNKFTQFIDVGIENALVTMTCV